MSHDRQEKSFWRAAWRAAIGITAIIFLLYSVLLMREFSSGNGDKKTLTMALDNILTEKSFVVALVAASVVFLGHKYLRGRG